MVHLSWNPVTTNSDGTATDDIDHYDIYRRPFGSTTTSQRWIGRSDDTVQDFSGYAPGSGWWFSVEAWDQTGNRSGRGPEVGLTMARKDTPPQPPSTPTTNTKITVVDVLWNGLPAFGSWPGDFDYVEVHCSTVTGFTPTTATFIGRLYDAGNQVMSTGVPGVPLYFKLIAVDTSGNKSTPSGEAAGTPNLLLGPARSRTRRSGSKTRATSSSTARSRRHSFGISSPVVPTQLGRSPLRTPTTAPRRPPLTRQSTPPPSAPSGWWRKRMRSRSGPVRSCSFAAPTSAAAPTGRCGW
jgi:hypothetical protein